MEIHIENLRSGESNYEASKILFRLFSRRYFITMGITLAAAALLLIAGLHAGYDSIDSNTTYNEESRTYVTYTTKYIYHVTYGLGIAFFVLFLLQLIGFLRVRSSYFREAKIRSDRRIQAGNKFTAKITNHDLHYQDFELDQVTKWSVYTNYLFCDSYVFLFTSSSLWVVVPIDLNGVSPVDVNELRNFLKGRLPERKIIKLF